MQHYQQQELKSIYMSEDRRSSYPDTEQLPTQSFCSTRQQRTDHQHMHMQELTNDPSIESLSTYNQDGLGTGMSN